MTQCIDCGSLDMGASCPLQDCRMKPRVNVPQRRHQGVASARVTSWQYEWHDCPFGQKMLLLTRGSTAVIGHTDANHVGYKAWAPLPDRDKETEARLGIL